MVKNRLQFRKHRKCSFDPWVERSTGGGNGNPLQYSCLRNPVDRGPGGLQSMVTKMSDTAEQLNNKNT